MEGRFEEGALLLWIATARGAQLRTWNVWSMWAWSTLHGIPSQGTEPHEAPTTGRPI